MAHLKSYTHYINRFKNTKQKTEQLLFPIPGEKFTAKPPDGGWSAAECINHLVEAGESYFEKIHVGLANMTSLPNADPNDAMSIRWHFRLFVQYLEPPVSFKSKAPKLFQPKQESLISKEQILRQFSDLQDRFLKVLYDGQGKQLDLSAIKTKNPVIPLLSMSVAECIAVTEAHQRRHLEQAARVLDLAF